jgi:hypothetical protein
MISPPSNVVWSLVFVPVFKWEEVEPVDHVANAPVASNCEGGSSEVPPSPSTPNMRLVFKGFEWRPAPEYVLYPAASWANCYDGGSSEVTADSVKTENDRRQRASEAARQQAALAARHTAHPGIDPSSAPAVPTEPSEPSE